jgi:NADPH-dependent glutamate synthase beta subunit-like oxidoreductase/CO/xanthine dehydrogenase FAD-binding subunit
MRSFHHVNAKSVNQAIKLLRKYEGKAKLIAGGTDLLGTLKDRILPEYPEVIINLKGIPGLDYIKEDTKGLKIGALAKLADIAKSPTVKGKNKLLVEAAKAVATPHIRSMSTMGGNLCQDVRCWYYRYPHHIGGEILCYLKGGKGCYALTGENQYNSIFGASRVTCPPCSSYCPGTVDIPSYLSKIREGDLREAAKILLEANPFPSITGRVCPHPCEQECHRDEIDESVSIRASERFLGDYILENAKEIINPPETDTGKSVAIVGSGPAGLSAAYYLRISGHRVTVYDRMEEAGGMLIYGMPAYRLPKDIVRRVVKMLENLGVKFKLNVDVGKDVTVGDLKRDFDNVFLASGAWRQQSIGLKGEEFTKSGLEFLTNVNRGIKEIPGKKVLVIGGGNVAVDVGITALRLGSEEVTLACLESRKEMPALKWEIEQAVEEGVKLMPSWGPYRVLESNGKVKGVELVRCISVFDKEGRFAPAFNDGVKERVEADQIIMAVGQTTDLAFIDPEWSLEVDRGLIVVDPEAQGTNIPGVFAGGEVTSGPATVIQAIAAGKRAAVAMALLLKGAGPQAEDKDEKTIKPFLKFNSEYFKRTSQVKMPRLPISERGIDVEDALGLGLSEIETEANRCFNCGCVGVNSSDIAPALIALKAKIKIAGPRGVRTIPTEDFFITLGSALKPDEIVTEIQVPQPSDRAKQTFIKFRLRNPIDFAIVSVASVITVEDGVCKDARIVLGAVAPIPIRATKAEEAIKGKAINVTTAEEAGEAAVADAILLSKNAYKVEITKALVKRAILF